METHAPTLSEHERFLVTALLDDSSSRARRRARILLESADGQDPTSIARALNTRTRSIHLALSVFDEKRLDIFSAAARKRVQAPLPTTAAPINADLNAHSTMRQAARHILKQQFSKLTIVEDDVRAAQDIEAVHDMRVACRRLNSAFRLFRNELPAKRVKRLRGVLEKLRDTLGEIRNLDVLGEDLDAYRADAATEDQPQLEALAAAWQGERAAIHAELVALLDSPRVATWKKRMDAFLDDDMEGASPRVAEALPTLLWKQYGTVRAYETAMRHATLEQLHALRIDIKRLRYTLEFFRDVLADGSRMGQDAAENEITDTMIKPLVALQDQLGSIQDAVVAGQALTDFIAAQAQEAKELGAAAADFRVIAAYHARLQERIVELQRAVPEKARTVLGARYRIRLGRAAAAI